MLCNFTFKSIRKVQSISNDVRKFNELNKIYATASNLFRLVWFLKCLLVR